MLSYSESGAQGAMDSNFDEGQGPPHVRPGSRGSRSSEPPIDLFGYHTSAWRPLVNTGMRRPIPREARAISAAAQDTSSTTAGPPSSLWPSSG